MGASNRHIISAALAFLAGLPILLLLGLQVWQQEVRREMKEKLETAELQTLVLRATEWHWKEEGKEIRVGDQLFDIRTMEKEGDRYRFTGLFDHQETAIENWLAGRSGNEGKALVALLLLVQAAAILPLLALPFTGSPGRPLPPFSVFPLPIPPFRALFRPPVMMLASFA